MLTMTLSLTKNEAQLVEMLLMRYRRSTGSDKARRAANRVLDKLQPLFEPLSKLINE